MTDQPTAAAEALSAAAVAAPEPNAAEEWVNCPECGEAAMIDPTQRRAEDFCRRCDFPLFWARADAVAFATNATGASLRRLPGTVGRAAAASIPCPHCGEPNTPTAIICVRCSEAMVLPPEPEPVVPAPAAPPPPPAPAPVPEPDTRWKWWLLAAGVLVVLALGLWWLALR